MVRSDWGLRTAKGVGVDGFRRTSSSTDLTEVKFAMVTRILFKIANGFSKHAVFKCELHFAFGVIRH